MKKFIILDTEGMSTAKPYNIGFLVGDNHGNIYQQENLAVLPAIWDNLANCLQSKEMTHKNIQEILQDVEQKKYKYVSCEQALKILLESIEKYQIKEVWAYNAAFDKAALKRLFKENFEYLENLVAFYDIMPAILYSRLLKKKYVKFCTTNNFISSKGNIQMTAEVVYRYLTQDLEFVEEHTGLADCQIEYKILLEAIHSKKKIEKKNCCTWKVLKKFCEENQCA